MINKKNMIGAGGIANRLKRKATGSFIQSGIEQKILVNKIREVFEVRIKTQLVHVFVDVAKQ